MNVADNVAESYRTGEPVKVNPNNKHTSKRRKMFDIITEQTGGDNEAAIDYSMSIIRDNQGRIKQYVLSKNEMPAEDLEQLAAQAYQLRCREIDEMSKTASVPEQDALILLESNEAEHEETDSSESDSFLGELAAPIGIVGNAVVEKKISTEGVDNFVDPALVTGILNTAAQKINSADLRRAAQDKPAGILGFLGQGGTSAYNALRKYFKDPAHKAEKDAVLNGMITDISQLSGYGGNIGLGTGTTGMLGATGQQLIDNIAREKKKEELRKALPFIIGGVLVIVLIIIFVYRSQHKK